MTKPRHSDDNVFSAKVAIALFLVGVFSFSAFITLSTFAPELLDGDDAQAHALSHSAIGYAGIVKLIKSTGANITVRRAPLSTPRQFDFVVSTPRSMIKITGIEQLGAWRVLIVLPKWTAMPSMSHKGWVGQSYSLPTNAVEEILQELAPKAKLTRASSSQSPMIKFDRREAERLRTTSTLTAGPINELQSVSAPELIPVATTAAGVTILGVIRHKEQPDIYVLTDPDLLNTQGISNLNTARAGVAILDALRAEGGPIAFDVTMNGYARSRSLLRLALEPPLLALTLTFVIVSALLAWRAATRDGPAAPGGRTIAFGKRALADNSAALFRLAGREHTMAKRYADLTRSNVALRMGVARDGAEATSTELDRIATIRNVTPLYSALAQEAASAATPEQAVAIARKLQTWEEEMTRATR